MDTLTPNTDTNLEEFNTELRALLSKHGVVLSAEPVIDPETGTVRAKPVLVKAPKKTL